MGFRFLTSGESHGKCLTAIIEGLPSGITLLEEYINSNLAERQRGYGRGGRMKIENDKAQINSGVRFGITTGAPICLEIINKDWTNWLTPMSVSPVDLNLEEVKAKRITNVRPGHADYAGAIKYNTDDIRNILERSSARETTTRVAVGAVAKAVLKAFNIKISSKVTKIGTFAISGEFNPDEPTEELKAYIDKTQQDGDTLGGIFELKAIGLPVGLGSHVHWDRKLDGKIAQSIMSIPAIKSVSVGEGDKASELSGSKFHDEIYINNGEIIRKTNNAGGIEGGMTNGAPVIVKAIMKAIPTMKKPLNSIDLYSKTEHVAHFERSDVCAVPAAAVVGEAMLAIVLLEVFLEKFGGDSLEEIKSNYNNYVKKLIKEGI